MAQEILTYKLVNENEKRKQEPTGMYFGEHFPVDSHDYEWLMSEDGNIGLRKKVLSEPGFCCNFFEQPDVLIIRQHQSLPKIHRMSNPTHAVLSKTHTGAQEIKDLISLLLSPQKTVHNYLASLTPDGKNPNLLTFSLNPPVTGNYKLGYRITIIADNSAIKPSIETTARELATK